MQSKTRSARPKPRVGLIVGALIISVTTAACVEKPVPETGSEPPPAGFLPEKPPAAVGCGAAGRMHGPLYGAIEAELDWETGRLDCEGMPRPEGRGARLRFSGEANGVPIAIIIAVPGLERAKTALELPSNVTLIDEADGRFFSTADIDTCWTDVQRQDALGNGDRFAVAGRVYCISPLVEVHGDSSILLTELSFTGLLDWGAS